MQSTARLAALAIAATLGLSGTAHAGSWMCIPDAAGATVVSGGATGTCTGATPVKVPTTAADQQKLIDMLPYMNFQAAGIGGKPTIQIKGANLQVRKTSDMVPKDGTGNVIIGDGVNYRNATNRAGSDNLVVGWDNEWNGVSNVLVGQFHKSDGTTNLIAGRQNSSSGSGNVMAGVGGTATAHWGMVNGYFNKTGADYATLLGGSHKTLTTPNAIVADGSGTDVHWVRYDSTGKVIGSSEPLAYSYASGGYYSLTQFTGVDLNACSFSVTPEGPDNQVTTAVATNYYNYAYVRFNKPSGTGTATAMNVPHTLTANCNKQPGAA